jgi:hypothetical protein
MRCSAATILTAVMLLAAPAAARATPGWSDPVVVAPAGSDAGPLLAPLPGGRMALADSQRPPMFHLEEGPSEMRLAQENDDGSFTAPRSLGAASGALRALATDPLGTVTAVGDRAYRGGADGPFAASALPRPELTDVAALTDGSAVAVAVTSSQQLAVSVAPPGAGFGGARVLASDVSAARVAAAADGTAVAAWLQGDWASTEVRAAWRAPDGTWSAPQVVVTGAQDSTDLRLAAAGAGRAVLAADTGGTLRVAVARDHSFTELTSFGNGTIRDLDLDAAGDAIATWVEYGGATRVRIARLDAPAAQWSAPQPIGSCSADVATAIDSHGTGIVALIDKDDHDLSDRLSAALWPRDATLPQPAVLWDEPAVPTDVAVGVDSADRATIAFRGYTAATGERPLIAVRSAGAATDAAAAAPHDPRLEPTNCSSPPPPPAAIRPVPPGPAPAIHIDKAVRLRHGRLVLRLGCSATSSACSGRLSATASAARFRRAALVAMPRGAWRTVRLTTTHRMRSLAARRRLPLRLSVTSRFAGRTDTITTRRVTL